ncbi:MAG: response regulator [Ruthenibacterium sp.]
MIYKVLIVEDETPILNNLVQKIGNLALPLVVAGTATDGEEALECIAREQPHILLTDVRMPGMDGLTLCSRLEKQSPQIKKVILSGYGEFEYAQKAIQYHVSDYLLKPVNPEQLKQVMQGLCEVLQEETSAQEYKILAQHLTGGSSELTLPCQFSGKEFGIYLICLGNLLEHTFAVSDPSFYAALWKQADLDGFLQANAAPAEGRWCIAEKSPNEQILVLSSFQKDFAGALHSHLEKRLSAYCCTTICAGDAGVSFHAIWQTAQHLRQLLHSRLVPCTAQVLTPSISSFSPGAQTDTLQQLVLRGIRSRQHSAFQTALENYFFTLEHQQTPQQLLERSVLQLTEKLTESTDSSNQQKKAVCNHLYQMIAEQKNVSTLYQMLAAQLCDLFSAYFHAYNSGEELARMVQKYIEENYREDISVETLSEVFHFSASYIGRVFRTQFGVPPVKYLLHLRMEQAKQLIDQNGEISFALIAEMVGFSDSHYFSRMFRAVVGITPSKYKKQVTPAVPAADSCKDDFSSTAGDSGFLKDGNAF